LRDAPAGAAVGKASLPDEYLTRTLALFEMYKLSGIEAVNVGWMDMNMGAEYLLSLQEKFGTPFISANITQADVDGERIFPPYKIVTKVMTTETVRIAYLGVTKPFGYKGMPEALVSQYPYRVKDGIETIKEFVPQLRKEADLVVLLLYAKMNNEEALRYLKPLSQAESPDLVICSAFDGMNGTRKKVGTSTVVSPGYEGRQIGEVLVTLNSSKQPVQYYNHLVDIRQTIPPVAPYNEMIARTLQLIQTSRSKRNINQIRLD
jgi:2',3'-cyclic-nucleotide 2'-phosphodiesterase (5'-nucleotidase family)